MSGAGRDWGAGGWARTVLQGEEGLERRIPAIVRVVVSEAGAVRAAVEINGGRADWHTIREPDGHMLRALDLADELSVSGRAFVVLPQEGERPEEEAQEGERPEEEFERAAMRLARAFRQEAPRPRTFEEKRAIDGLPVLDEPEEGLEPEEDFTRERDIERERSGVCGWDMYRGGLRCDLPRVRCARAVHSLAEACAVDPEAPARPACGAVASHGETCTREIGHTEGHHHGATCSLGWEDAPQKAERGPKRPKPADEAPKASAAERTLPLFPAGRCRATPPGDVQPAGECGLAQGHEGPHRIDECEPGRGARTCRSHRGRWEPGRGCCEWTGHGITWRGRTIIQRWEGEAPPIPHPATYAEAQGDK